MDNNLSTNRKFKRMFANILSIFFILAMAFQGTGRVYAAPSSPFVGKWEATDLDRSDVRLVIAGPPSGPFQITWTDSYMSFCDGEAGIVRGTGMLNESDPYLLEADLHVECFTTGATEDAHLTLRYHAATDTLSARYGNGKVVIWHRPGGGQEQEPPALGLRINYGHDWVESFYEAGHSAWITVTESDRVTVKATAELVTEPKDFWGDETGFQTRVEDWSPAPPDIQPNDWVFGWVDNGASAQVQIGEIQGTIDLETDSIRGTVLADWFAEKLYTICDPWGLSDLSQYRESSVYPDGVDEYECSWSGALNILPGQELGVWYHGPDGHAVANAFSTSEARIHASVTGDFFFVTDFNPGTLNISIYESTDEDAALLWNSEVDTDETGFVHVSPDVHGLDLKPDNYLVISDGRILKGLVLELISLDVFDTEDDIMAGTAPAGSEVMVIAAPGPEWEVQTVLNVLADPVTSTWQADFSSIGFDITEEMREWSFASISDEDGDTNETSSLPAPPNPRFSVFPEWEYIEGWDWPDGALVSASIDGKDACIAEGYSGHPDWDSNALFVPLWFAEGCDVVVGDNVTLTDKMTTREHTVRNLAVVSVDAATNTVSGTADPVAEVHVWPHGYNELLPTADTDGNWTADFTEIGPDLVGGMGGRTEVRDEVGNATAVEWWVPVTFVVTSTADVIDNNGICTLREAIIAANTNSPSGDTDGECPGGMDNVTDTILLAADQTYSLTIDSTYENDSLDGDLDIWDNSTAIDLIIKAAGDGKVTISQDASVDDRVLKNLWATVKIQGVILTGGSKVSGGGGLINVGTMDLVASEVSGNSVGWDGGGIYNAAEGKLTIDSSIISGNFSSAFAGGIMNKGELTVINSEITGNTDLYGGGGIRNEGTLNVDHSVLSANSSGQGGAVHNTGTATIANGTLVGGADPEDANTADGGGGLFSSGTLTVIDSTVEGNQANYGGGLFNWISGTLVVDHSTITNNLANEGGGLHNKEGSTAIIKNGTIFSGNYAKYTGGGIENWGIITITETVLRENKLLGEAGAAVASTGPEGSAASITASCIVGNEEIAVFFNLIPPMNATGNWWGDPFGPSGAGTGSGDSVSDNVDFSGWLLEPPDICTP